MSRQPYFRHELDLSIPPLALHFCGAQPTILADDQKGPQASRLAMRKRSPLEAGLPNAVIFENSDFFRICWQRKHAMVLCGISISQPDTIENIEGLGKLGVKGIPRNGPGRRKRLLLASGSW